MFGAISFSDLLNDMIRSLILAIYPLLKGRFQLTCAQIGRDTLTYQVTASLSSLLPGSAPTATQPCTLAIGMGCTPGRPSVLAAAPNY